MKYRITLTLALLVFVLASAALRADTPTAISYQGYLTNAAGNPLDTTVGMTFNIYDAAAAGTVKWDETHVAVVVDSGNFNVELGSVLPITDVVFEDVDRWLGITVGTDPEIVPRTKLLTVPYAFRISTIDGASGGTVTGDLTIAGHLLVENEGATIGWGNTNTMNSSLVVGVNNNCTAGQSVISGGSENTILKYHSGIGSGHDHTIDAMYSFIGGGFGNVVTGDAAVVAGGDGCSATGRHSAIGGGAGNHATDTSAAVSGGRGNSATGFGAFIGGGVENYVGGYASAILGGYRDTIVDTADYSYLFGVGAKLEDDSTFLVEMPHIVFGSTAKGSRYEFPDGDGSADQIMKTDGSGQLSWTTIPGGGAGGWTDDGTTVRLTTGTDNVGIGTNSPTQKLHVAGNIFVEGKATIGPSHTNSGSYAFVAGSGNTVSGSMSTVGGGTSNVASGSYTTVAGGKSNVASGPYYSTVGGGWHNTADGDDATISGGAYNHASGHSSSIVGGDGNDASGRQAFIGGGAGNVASDTNTTVGGGTQNTASGVRSAVCGGYQNVASGRYGLVGGGLENVASGDNGAIGGGAWNGAHGLYSTVPGGMENNAFDEGSTVGGGMGNVASAPYSTVCGGSSSAANGGYATVGGGLMNTAVGEYSFAAGRRAQANHNGSFVWADDHDADFASWANDEFAIRATAGMRLGISGIDRICWLGPLGSGEGAVQTYGPNGTFNAALTSLAGYPSHGFLALNDCLNNLQAGAYVSEDPQRAGMFFGNGQNGNLNLWLSHVAGYPNNGWISVVDSVGVDQAMLYVNAAGDGIVQADVKNFRMANPNQPGTEIWYASLEGPEAAAYIRGTARLIDGRAQVSLPEHFEAVASEDGITVQLTPLSADSKGLAVVEKEPGRIVVVELAAGRGDYEFDYTITAVRKGYEDYKVVREAQESLSVAAPAEPAVSNSAQR